MGDRSGLKAALWQVFQDAFRTCTMRRGHDTRYLQPGPSLEVLDPSNCLRQQGYSLRLRIPVSQFLVGVIVAVYEQRNMTGVVSKYLSRGRVRKPGIQRYRRKCKMVTILQSCGCDLSEVHMTIPSPVNIRIVDDEASSQSRARE